MNFNKENFIKSLDNMFESQMKNMFTTDELNSINLKNKMNNDVFIIEKKLIESDDKEFLDKINLKNKKKLSQAISDSGTHVIIVYNERKTPIYVDGRWDGGDTTFINIKNKKYIKIIKENKYGIININGSIIVKPNYVDIKEVINEKYLWVSNNKDDYSYFLMSLQEKALTPKDIFFSGKQLITKKDGNVFLFGKTRLGEMIYDITNQKHLITSGKFKKIKINEETNLFIVQDNTDMFGVYKNDTQLIETIYEHINIFNNIIQVTKNKKIGAFDLNGNNIIPLEYDKIINIAENKITLSKNNIKETITIGE